MRSALPGDLRPLWELDRICFEPGIAYSRSELRRFLELPGAECVVAESGGAIEGFALGHPEPPGLARIVTLDVHPSARRRGLGRRLLETLIDRLAAAGAVRVRLEVDVRNSGAIAFYRTLGFRKTVRIASYYGPGLDAWEMERVASPESRASSRRGGAGSVPTQSPAAPAGAGAASRNRRPTPED